MNGLVIVFCIAIVATNASNVNKVVKTKVSYEMSNGYDTPKTTYQQTSYAAGTKLYHGQYQGYCGNDGFYYNDEASFVICSNGNAYIQPCAPGSKNSAYSNYQHGTSYYYRDFCDINLVDDGYTLKYGYNNGYYGNNYNSHAAHGYGKSNSYGHNAGYGYNPGYNSGHKSGYGFADNSYGGSYQKRDYQTYQSNPSPKYSY